jgi:hypothetical protein
VLNAISEGEGKGACFYLELPLYFEEKDDGNGFDTRERDIEEAAREFTTSQQTSVRGSVITFSSEDFVQSIEEVGLENGRIGDLLLMSADGSESAFARKNLFDEATAEVHQSAAVNVHWKRAPSSRQQSSQFNLDQPPPHFKVKKKPGASSKTNESVQRIVCEVDTSRWRAGLKVLIVDDSLTNRKVLLRMLLSHGYVHPRLESSSSLSPFLL